MGYIRGSQREAFNRAQVRDAVVHFIGEQEIAQVLAAQDPFQCDDPCPGHPAGHFPIRSAGDTVCAYCSKVFWR